MAASQKAGRSFTLRSVKQVKADLAVASVAVGPITINSIWVNRANASPVIAWPQSVKGHPLLTIEDSLRNDIEAAIAKVLKGWRLP